MAADVAGFSRLIGDDEEGTLRALRSHRGEPIDPLLAEHGDLGLAHYLAGRNEESIEAAQECIRMRPGFVSGQRLRCAALAQSGRTEDARDALEEVRKLQPDISASLLRRTLPYASS